MSQDPSPDHLKAFLNSKGIWHRFIEFDEPVKTVEQASRKVPVERIAKSMVLIDYNSRPLLAILPARNRVSLRKIKKVLAIRDVRLASPEEVVEHSGYAAGGVPPFNRVRRVLMDPQVLKNEISIVGGGEVNKLVEVRTQDIVVFVGPSITDISDE